MNLFIIFLKAHGFPPPVEEYRFHPTRQFRFDYAWPELKVAIEQQGGLWRKAGGAHQRAGHMRDMLKNNAAQVFGWIVLQFPPDQMYGLECVQTLKAALALGEQRLRYQIIAEEANALRRENREAAAGEAPG